MTPAIFGLSGPELTADERDFFTDTRPAGYILFARNCQDRKQLRALTDALRNLHAADHLFISIDQEGGRVARLPSPEWPVYPAGQRFAELWQIAPASAIEAARVNAHALALDLAEAGISVNFHAPFDVRRPDTADAIGDRALGSDGRSVAALGRAVLDGHGRGGVVGCLKHMPGHGRAMSDSHQELPVVSAPEEELADDLLPFERLSDAPLGMSAHIVYTAWDEELPATLSPTVIKRIIREKIGFDGLLLTDDIDMKALSGGIVERSRAALDAGCDIVLNCWARLADMRAIAEACPDWPETTAQRYDTVMRRIADAAPEGDGEELRAKRDALFAAAGLGQS
jgi:beta-N-acetylhexosaminidase